MREKLKYVGAIVIFLVTLEVLLRLTGVTKGSTERETGEYQVKFKSGDTWFQTWTPNSTVDYGNGEFFYENHYNDLGHREIDFSAYLSDSSSNKYIFIGDSFTEGDGAPEDSTWVKAFENRFTREIDTNFLAYNAGVCGSDIFFNYIMLREKLIESRPRAVFECVNNSDILDVYYYGGLDRFKSDGTFVSSNKLVWENWFAKIHLFRLFVKVFTPYNQNLVNERTWEEDEKRIVELMAEQILINKELCEQYHVDYYLVFMPVPDDIVGLITEEFYTLPKLLENKVEILDIHPCMYQKFETRDIAKYSWERNGHYTGEGYFIMGDCVFEEFVKNKSSSNF